VRSSVARSCGARRRVARIGAAVTMTAAPVALAVASAAITPMAVILSPPTATAIASAAQVPIAASPSAAVAVAIASALAVVTATIASSPAASAVASALQLSSAMTPLPLVATQVPVGGHGGLRGHRGGAYDA
jgi:hypothetical protein